VEEYNNPIVFGNLINTIFSNVQSADAENSIKIVSTWQVITARIGGNGGFLSSHSKIVELNKGLLLVEADHPGCINLLQMYKRQIIRALRKEVPALEIRNIVYRLKGSDATLSRVQKMPEPIEAVIAEIKRKQDKEDEALKKYEEKRKEMNYKTLSSLPEFKEKIEKEEKALKELQEKEKQSKSQNVGYLPPDLMAKFAELEKICVDQMKK